MTVGDRIRKLRESKGLRQDELAELMNMKNKSSVSKIESAGNEVTLKNIKRASNALGCTVGYLMGWEESAYNEPRTVTPELLTAVNRVQSIIVLGRVAAGVPIDMSEDIIGQENITAELARKGEIFGLQIRGKSMEPEIHDGDVVIVKQQDDVESGEIAIIAINGDDATCKRLVKYKNGIRLVSINPAFEPMDYTNEEIEQMPIRIIGKVMETRHKYY